ncbi:hypothetical protein ACQKL6_14980 [Peribacillus sp. NPDC097197]|uniref:hypothetical protein n=1 Tax=Peribacillus sp. NPDC097197 TaxID=3390615 RepID=UPI003D077F57
MAKIKREENRVFALMKFGSKKNLERLLYNGELYTRPIQQFRNIDDTAESLRRDKYEGATKVYNSGVTVNITNTETNETLVIDEESGLLEITEHRERKANIYCMTAMTSKLGFDFFNYQDYLKLDLLRQFGPYSVIIRDVQSFIERIESAIKKDDNLKGFQRGLVDYVDVKAVNGEYFAFNKPIEYSYQWEYRFLIKPQIYTDNPIHLKIGNISDIAMLIPTIELMDLIELKESRNNRYGFTPFLPKNVQLPKEAHKNVPYSKKPTYKRGYSLILDKEQLRK